MAECKGNQSDHCCYLNGYPCRYLEEGTVKGRRWACGLLKDAGSWAGAYADPRYVRDVKPVLDELGLPDCGDWPRRGETCATCGVTGR